MSDNSKRFIDRRKSHVKIHHKNLRKIDRRKEDKIDQNIYKAIMIIVPFVLIVWALNLR